MTKESRTRRVERRRAASSPSPTPSMPASHTPPPPPRSPRTASNRSKRTAQPSSPQRASRPPSRGSPAPQAAGAPAATAATNDAAMEALLHEADEAWDWMSQDDRLKVQGFLRETMGLPEEEQLRQMREVLEDHEIKEDLRAFEANADNWQNCLGRPGQMEALLKRLMAPAGKPTRDRPPLFPSYGEMNIMQQRAGQPQSILTKLVADTQSGIKVVKFIQTPTLSEHYLTDLMCRLAPEFKKGLRLFLGSSIVQAQKVAALLRACMKQAEDLGGKILPFFLSEHDNRATDHEKLEWSIDLITGKATLTIMSSNANNRAMAQEAAHADDPGGAPKSFEIMFQGQFDARDDESHFWRHIQVIFDGLVLRRSMGSLIMPTERLMSTWLKRANAKEIFDESDYRRRYSAERAEKAADAQTRIRNTREKKDAAEALRLRRERAAFASAGTADEAVKAAAAAPKVAPPAEAVKTLTMEEREQAQDVAQGLQHRLNEVLAEFPQSHKALADVRKLKSKVRSEVNQSIRVGKVPKSKAAAARPKPYASRIPRVNTRYRPAVIEQILTEKGMRETEDGWEDVDDAAAAGEDARTTARVGFAEASSEPSTAGPQEADVPSTSSSAARSVVGPSASSAQSASAGGRDQTDVGGGKGALQEPALPPNRPGSPRDSGFQGVADFLSGHWDDAVVDMDVAQSPSGGGKLDTAHADGAMDVDGDSGYDHLDAPQYGRGVAQPIIPGVDYDSSGSEDENEPTRIPPALAQMRATCAKGAVVRAVGELHEDQQRSFESSFSPTAVRERDGLEKAGTARAHDTPVDVPGANGGERRASMVEEEAEGVEACTSTAGWRASSVGGPAAHEVGQIAASSPALSSASATVSQQRALQGRTALAAEGGVRAPSASSATATPGRDAAAEPRAGTKRGPEAGDNGSASKKRARKEGVVGRTTQKGSTGAGVIERLDGAQLALSWRKKVQKTLLSGPISAQGASDCAECFAEMENAEMEFAWLKASKLRKALARVHDLDPQSIPAADEHHLIERSKALLLRWLVLNPAYSAVADSATSPGASTSSAAAPSSSKPLTSSRPSLSASAALAPLDPRPSDSPPSSAPASSQHPAERRSSRLKGKGKAVARSASPASSLSDLSDVDAAYLSDADDAGVGTDGLSSEEEDAADEYMEEDDDEDDAGPSGPSSNAARTGYTPAEDKLILREAKEKTPWAEIAALIPHGNVPGVMNRYELLKRGVKRRSFSAEEDNKLRAWEKEGRTWKWMAQRLGRTTKSVRQRWRYMEEKKLV